MIIKELLLEASKYDSMFQNISKENLEFVRDNDLSKLSVNINDNIKWAKSYLKKEDRIIWFLRLLKIKILQEIIGLYPEDSNIDNTFPDDDDNLDIKKEKNKLVKELRKTQQKANISDVSSLPPIMDIKNKLIHYIGQERIAGIQNYVFRNETPEELFDKLDEIEQEWIEKIGKDTVTVQEGDKEVIQFNDGFSWWLLNRGACREEADAMGHCGNVPSLQSGDRILSLRKKVVEDIWAPHLTFILHDDGHLGEMKGKNNDKPDEKYHPYIIELLKNTKIIKGIKGGGYLAENNFSLSDLEKTQMEELIKINPDLLSIFEKYEIYGPTDKVIGEIQEKLYESPLPAVDDITDKMVILDSWGSLEDFANFTLFEPLRDLFEAIDEQDSSIDEDDLENLANDLKIKDEIYLDILKHIPENYLDKISDNLNLDVDISSYNGLREISENIDKSYYGELIRKGIVYVYKIQKKIKEHPELKDYIEMVIDDLFYYSLNNFHATLDYDINDLERSVELTMDLNDFVSVLYESLNLDEGEISRSEEDYSIAVQVAHTQDWAEIDMYELKDRINEIKSDKINNANELYNKFQRIINIDDIQIKEIPREDAIDIAKYFTKYIDLNEGIDFTRLKNLAGV